MLLQSTSVSVTPREFTSAANGDMLDVEDRGNAERILSDGVCVYNVRQGRCIELRLQNNGVDEVDVWWDREEVDVNGRRYRNGSGVRLRAGEGAFRMPMFRMRGNAIQVAFSNGKHVVLLRMRFENVAEEASGGGSGGADVPEMPATGGSGGSDAAQAARRQALVHMQELLEEMEQLMVKLREIG